MPRFTRLLSLLTALCLPLLASAPAHADAASELRRFIDGVQTLSAHFEQKQTDEKGAVVATSSGRMWLARPGRFRWDYEAPYPQLMVCDGEKIWLYDPDLAQVTVRPAAQALQGTPAALLSQGRSLTDTFTLEDGGEADGASLVRLTPKSADSDFRSIELRIKAGIPQSMKFHDQLGGTTEIVFDQIQTGARADAGLFKFTPPKGVEVVEGG